MKFGLTDEQINFIHKTVLIPLQKKGAKIFFYGSRARGDYKKFSDLDIMIEADQSLSKELGEIKNQLENSNFPYKVDLVEYKDFADSYKEGYLKDRVLITS